MQKKTTKTSPPASGVYLFTGEDEFRKRLYLEKLKKRLLGEDIDAFNCESFYGRESSAGDIIRSLETLPLPAGRKLVIVKEPESLPKDDKGRLKDYLKHRTGSRAVLVLLTERHASRDDNLISALSKEAKAVDFSRPGPEEISAWIVKELKDRGKTISRRSAGLIRDASGQDLTQAYSIIEQLSIFSGERERITDDDAEYFTSAGTLPESSAFRFLDYINDRDTGSSLSILKNLFSSGSSPAKIIGLLSWHITRLIAVKRMLSKGISRNNMLSYFNMGSHTLDRLISQAESFTLRQLKGQLDALLDTDLMLKRSSFKDEFLLEMLVVKWGRI